MSTAPLITDEYRAGGRLMFAQSWEDAACDLAALQPHPRDTILAITSGVDNVLGFLLTVHSVSRSGTFRSRQVIDRKRTARTAGSRATAI